VGISPVPKMLRAPDIAVGVGLEALCQHIKARRSWD
jgi:hypothetical protein